MCPMYRPPNSCSTILFCAALNLTIGTLPAAAATPRSETDHSASDAGRIAIRVISYNVQFLPGVAAVANQRPNAPYRAAVLGDRLPAWDIVGLNEAFDDTARSQILDGLRSAWKDRFTAVTGPQPTEPGRFNGGLVLATHLPVLEQHSIIYSRFSRPEDFGLRADGFASKGVLHARIQPAADRPVTEFMDVFVTHMEARDDSLRPFQYQEMAEFISRHADAEHPTLIMGDFNTRGNPEYQADPESQYNLLMKTLADALPEKRLTDLWCELKGSAVGGTSEQESSEIGRRIDYVMLAVPNAQSDIVCPTDIRVNPFLDAKVTALSDHSAVEADLSVATGEQPPPCESHPHDRK